MENKKFGEKSTAEEVAQGYDMRGKNVIVTGGYSGLGLETARVLATLGAQVFIVGRDITKCNQEVTKLKLITGNEQIQAMKADLASQASVRAFVEEFNALNIPLHLLINNAGVMNCPKGKTTDGIETHFGVNHVGHFVLTVGLIPRLIEGSPSRVVSLTSAGIRWKDINFDKCYGEWEAYGQSKTANALFSLELNKRFHDQGITSNAVHPGLILDTNLTRHGGWSWNFIKNIPKTMKSTKLGTLNKKTIPQGAATTLFVALSPTAAEGGKVYADCKAGPVPSHADDPEEARKLWDYTERLVGMKA